MPVKQRRDAAAHLVQVTVAGVREPAGDDAEVVELMKPWPRETPVQAEIAAIIDNITNGRGTQGRSLADAKAEVWKRHKLRAVLTVIVDEHANRLERLAACDVILTDFLPPMGMYRRNGWNADKMLSSILPTTATKIVRLFNPPVPVARPPMELRDVWKL